MITTENEFYIRFVLLLIEGGTDVLRGMLKHYLEQKKVTFGNFLSQVKGTIQSAVHITKKQLESLYSVSKEPPDLNKCDISILVYLLNEFFTTKGSSESKAINTIKTFRNDFFAHPKTASLDARRFNSIWSKLSMAILTLSHDFTENERERFKETIERLSNDALDINSAVETLRTLDQTDEFNENINIRLTQLDQAVQYCHQGIEQMTKQITELQKTFENQGMSTKVVHTVFGSVKLSALEQRTVDETERVLLSVSKESLSHLESLQPHQTVRKAVDNLVQDMKDKGLEVEDVSKGSIVFTIKCQSFEGLIALIDYFDSHINNHLDAISHALSELTGQKIEVHAMILTDRLSEELRRHERCSKTVKVAVKCSGLDSLKTALDVFGRGDAARNLFSGLQDALSEEVGKPINLQTAIDLEAMQKAIDNAKKELENGNNETDENYEIFQDAVEKLPVQRLMSNTSTRTYNIMAEQASGKIKQKEEIEQSASREKGIKSSVASVYLSSEEVTLSDKKSGLSSDYKSSEEYYECDPCITVGDHTEAEGFCTDCNEYLCSTCFRSHSRNKLSKHHVLLSKSDMPRKSPKFCNPCKVAGDKIKAVGFCEDCSDILCSGCFKGHPRNKFTRHHVILNDEALVEEDHDVTPSISKMKVTENMTSGVNTIEDFTFIQDINVKSDTDEKDSYIYITDMTLVSNNELVLCDNQCLKLVDINKNLIKDVLSLQCKANGITTISNDQIAVVLENSYQIQLVKVREKLTLDRSIKTNGNCVDMKMINNQLYVSYKQPVKFQILQLTGAIIKTIKPDDEILKHCTLPRYIAVRHDESVIYVSDWKTNKVMSLDMNGNMLSLYQGDLELPHGIIISPSGSVYVCNRNQHIVYKMTSDLSEAMVILGPGDGLEYPQAICLNKRNQHLYISSGCSEYQNTLKVDKC